MIKYIHFAMEYNNTKTGIEWVYFIPGILLLKIIIQAETKADWYPEEPGIWFWYEQ